MKTSKKILIGFMSIFCLSLLSFMITVDKGSNIEFVENEESLPNFTIIKAYNDCNVTLETNDVSSINFSHIKDSNVIKPYTLSGDTLILNQLKSGKHNLHYSVKSTNIQELIIDKANVGINIRQDSIKIISLNNGWLRVYKNSSINHLQLNAINKSRSNFYTDQINTLELHVNDADVTSNNRISNVNLKAENNASVRLQHVKKLSVECDSTSTYRIY